jgi:hypothetical protein
MMYRVNAVDDTDIRSAHPQHGELPMANLVAAGLSAGEVNAFRCAMTNLVMELRNLEKTDCETLAHPSSAATTLRTLAISRAAIGAEEVANTLGCEFAPVV